MLVFICNTVGPQLSEIRFIHMLLRVYMYVNLYRDVHNRCRYLVSISINIDR